MSDICRTSIAIFGLSLFRDCWQMTRRLGGGTISRGRCVAYGPQRRGSIWWHQPIEMGDHFIQIPLRRSGCSLSRPLDQPRSSSRELSLGIRIHDWWGSVWRWRQWAIRQRAIFILPRRRRRPLRNGPAPSVRPTRGRMLANREGRHRRVVGVDIDAIRTGSPHTRRDRRTVEGLVADAFEFAADLSSFFPP